MTITFGDMETAKRELVNVDFEAHSSALEKKFYCADPGNVRQVYTVAHGDPGANRTITVKRNAGTIGTIVIANGASENDVDRLNREFYVKAGDIISLESDGGGANSVANNCVIEFQRD